jgi:hypothetical protein
MVEFYGVLSDSCKNETSRRRTRNFGVVWSIFTVIISVPCLIVGILNDKLIYAIAVSSFFILMAISIFSIKPSERLSLIKIPIRVSIDAGEVIEVIYLPVEEVTRKKAVTKIKKVIDVGDWYYLIYADITNCFICQKDLLQSGSIKEFEEIFKNRIVVSSNKNIVQHK